MLTPGSKAGTQAAGYSDSNAGTWISRLVLKCASLSCHLARCYFVAALLAFSKGNPALCSTAYCIALHCTEALPRCVLQFGQLGVGDSEDRFEPVPVGALAGQPVKLLSCGWRHTIAVTDKGLVYTWGRGVNGQLGQANPVDLCAPHSSVSAKQLIS